MCVRNSAQYAATDIGQPKQISIKSLHYAGMTRPDYTWPSSDRKLHTIAMRDINCNVVYGTTLRILYAPGYGSQERVPQQQLLFQFSDMMKAMVHGRHHMHICNAKPFHGRFY
jgi:hypothetical protein